MISHNDIELALTKGKSFNKAGVKGMSDNTGIYFIFIPQNEQVALAWHSISPERDTEINWACELSHLSHTRTKVEDKVSMKYDLGNVNKIKVKL